MEGPRAFPRAHDGQEGMSLRDYFAAHALTGCVIEAPGGEKWSMVAKAAYAIADAMLEARK